MKAVQMNSYGGVEVLYLNRNTPKPTLSENQVLVEVYAASLNPVDWKIREGYFKQMVKLFFPITLGGDFAGKVVDARKSVSDVAVGSKVYGSAILSNGGSGSIAEFAAVNIKNIAKKPQSINFIEAAALPLVGASSLQALNEHIKLKKKQKILIHGGAGGIGHIAIQLAKSKGAYVATTVSTNGQQFVKQLGADEVVNYETADFARLLKDFDAVFDNVGGQVTEKSFQVLKKGGILVSMAGQPSKELAEKYQVIAIGQNTLTDTQHLQRLAKLVDSGTIKVHVDRIFPLEKTKEAFKYLEKDHPKGKVMVRIKD